MRHHFLQFSTGERGHLPAGLISTFKRKESFVGPHGTSTDRAVRGISIPFASDPLKQRAAFLYKLGQRFMPRHLLHKFCVLPYKAGVFCFQLYEGLIDQINLCAQERNVLLQNSGTLHVAEGGDQAAKCGQ